MRSGRRVRVKALAAHEKAAIAARCDRFIAETLQPRFLPTIRPTQFNYPVALLGKWRGRKYNFIMRYRSGFPENAGEEFESAYTRLDHLDEDIQETRFDVMWHRHTGQWFRLFTSKTLDEALDLIVTEGLLRPPV
jgi:hypothetical protein